jgi:hypothetical protein
MKCGATRNYALSRAQGARTIQSLDPGPRRGDDNSCAFRARIVYFRNNQKITDTTKLIKTIVVIGK